MNNHQIVLDNYLHGYVKFIIFYFLLSSILGSINYLKDSNDLLDISIGLSFLLLTIILLVIIIGKKGLSVSDNRLNRGISIANIFIILEKINLDEYTEFTYEKKEKTKLPWLLKFSILELFSNYNECSVYLMNHNQKKNKILISMSEFEMYNNVREFLERWSNLNEQDYYE